MGEGRGGRRGRRGSGSPTLDDVHVVGGCIAAAAALCSGSRCAYRLQQLKIASRCDHWWCGSRGRC